MRQELRSGPKPAREIGGVFELQSALDIGSTDPHFMLRMWISPAVLGHSDGGKAKL